MANNITYLLGAGASANAIPTVEGMKQSIRELSDKLTLFRHDQLNTEAFTSLPLGISEEQESLISIVRDINWLLDEAKKHETVDTLARKFYLTGDYTSLERLKSTLIVYFTIVQLCTLPINPMDRSPSPLESLIDKRYDSFIATIAQRKNERFSLKENIKILSWNYDLQFELSLKRYIGSGIHKIKEDFQIFPNHNSFALDRGDFINFSKFGMIKLNGNALWDNPSTTGESLKTVLFDKFFNHNDSWGFLSDMLFQYKWLHANSDKLLKESTRYFNFAWESDPSFNEKHAGHQNNINEAIRIAGITQIIVVIGYSFPVFNRETDKLIIDSMENLAKVYIQDKNPEKIQSTMENAFSRFQELPYIGGPPQVNFHLENNYNGQFIIPYEL